MELVEAQLRVDLSFKSFECFGEPALDQLAGLVEPCPEDRVLRRRRSHHEFELARIAGFQRGQADFDDPVSGIDVGFGPGDIYATGTHRVTEQECEIVDHGVRKRLAGIWRDRTKRDRLRVSGGEGGRPSKPLPPGYSQHRNHSDKKHPRPASP